MALIETINSLKQQGYADIDIIGILQDQGISPREINEAMAQSKIKQAVSEPASSFAQEENEGMTSDMQPSIINPRNEQQQGYEQQQYEQPQTPYPEIPIPSPSQSQNTSQQLIPAYSQEYQGQGEYQEGYGYPPESYGGEYGQEMGYGDGQYPQYAPDTSIITEIASQLISEKFTKTEKALTELAEFKSLLNSKVERVDERLKKIESIIDHLQMSLIRRSAEQEQNIEDIKSEIKLTQSSFGKIINPLTDRVREVEETRAPIRTKAKKAQKSTSIAKTKKKTSKK